MLLKSKFSLPEENLSISEQEKKSLIPKRGGRNNIALKTKWKNNRKKSIEKYPEFVFSFILN